MAANPSPPDPQRTILDRLRELGEAQIALILAAWFRGQRGRVIERLMQSPEVRLALWRELLPASENAGFSITFERSLQNIATAIVERELSAVQDRRFIRITERGRYVAPRIRSVYEPIGELPNINELVQARIRSSARRVVQINATTRRAIRRELAIGIERGYSREQIAQGVPADDYRGIGDVVEETYKGRARTIARTELAIIRNRSTLQGLEAKGYRRVRVYDSAECGLVGHDDPRKPANTVINIHAAYTFAISHPNCIRRFVPVIADE